MAATAPATIPLSPSPAPGSVGELRGFVDTQLTELGTDLPHDQRMRINNELDAIVATLGGVGVAPKDAAKAFAALNNAGIEYKRGAARAQDQRMAEKRITDAAAAVVPGTTTEDVGLADLTATEKNAARLKISERLFLDLANSGSMTIPALLATVDAHRTSNQISQETAEGVKRILYERVADIAKSIQSDLDAGTLSPSGIEARLNSINNPDLRNLVEAKFGNIVKSAKYSREADAFLNPPPGTATTTTAILDATLSTRAPEDALGIRRALSEKVSHRADEYRQLIGAGHKTIDDVLAEIDGMVDSVERDLLKKNFSVEASASTMRQSLDSFTLATPTTALGEIAQLVTAIESSTEFNALPDYIKTAYEKALDAKMSQAQGTHRYYQLKYTQQQAEGALAVQRQNEVARRQLFRDIRNYYLPAALIVAGIIGGGIVGGTVAEGGHVLVGSLLGAVPGSIWLGRSLITRGFDNTNRAETNVKLAEYAAEAQYANNNLHNIEAMRESMPIKYLNEIVKTAAEISWTTQGANSGMTREEWISRYIKDSGTRGLDTMLDTMMKMDLQGNVAVSPAPAMPK